jgi:peroxiredoxin
MKFTIHTVAVLLTLGISGATLPLAGQTDAPPSSATGSGSSIVHPDEKSIQPLKSGTAVPEIEGVSTPDGSSFDLKAATKGQTTVIVFYRGGWCPYCNTHLAELARVQPQLNAAGIKILALSPDSPATLSSYTVEKPLPYQLLADNRHAAAKAFGVAFAVDQGTQQRLKGYGIDLEKASGNPEAVLPVPAVFVVGPDGIIQYSHANADYKVRLSAEDLLKAAGVSTP